MLWGVPATSSCSRLHCYLGGWLLWKLEGLVPSLVGCGEWGLLGLQVGEAGNTLGLSAGPVTSHGVPKGDETIDTLNAVLQISNSALTIHPELLDQQLDSTDHRDWTFVFQAGS